MAASRFRLATLKPGIMPPSGAPPAPNATMLPWQAPFFETSGRFHCLASCNASGRFACDGEASGASRRVRDDECGRLRNKKISLTLRFVDVLPRLRCARRILL